MTDDPKKLATRLLRGEICRNCAHCQVLEKRGLIKTKFDWGCNLSLKEYKTIGTCIMYFPKSEWYKQNIDPPQGGMGAVTPREK